MDQELQQAVALHTGQPIGLKTGEVLTQFQMLQCETEPAGDQVQHLQIVEIESIDAGTGTTDHAATLTADYQRAVEQRADTKLLNEGAVDARVTPCVVDDDRFAVLIYVFHEAVGGLGYH